MKSLSKEQLNSLSELEKADYLELTLIEEEMKRQQPLKYYWWKLTPYRNNPEGFVRDIIGAVPTEQQKEALEAVRTGTHVSIKSGHGTGKTTFLSWIILWFLYTRYNARVPCTAPTEAQLKDVLWAEVSIWHQQMDEFFQKKFTITSDHIYHNLYPKTWFAVARTARKEKPEALQGFHGGELLFIIDEATGVAEEVFTVVRGALTEEANRCIMTSNPTRTQGFFYNSHTLWEGDPWHCLTFNGEDSPRVSERYVREIAVEFGKDSDMYRIRVLGEFPVEDDFVLIPKKWVEAAFERRISHINRLGKQQFDSCGVDVARYGENKTVFALVRHATVVGLLQYGKKNTMHTAENIIELCKRMESVNIKVDEIGVGGGVIDRCYQRGFPVTGVDVSKAATDKERFQNKRAEHYWNLRQRFEEGSISLYPLNTQLSRENKIKLIEQLCSIRYEYNPSGKIVIWSKEKMRKEGIKSPDLADAIMLAFADYYPQTYKPPQDTALKKWSDQLESNIQVEADMFERFANDFWKMAEYPIDEGEREDGMVWN